MRIGTAVAAGLWMLLGMAATAAETIKPEAVRIARDEGLKVEVFALRDAEMTL